VGTFSLDGASGLDVAISSDDEVVPDPRPTALEVPSVNIGCADIGR
jgi:hypothetical protein